MKEIPEITKSPCCNEFSPIEYEASLGKAIINQHELNLHFKLKPPSSKECSFVTKLKSEGKSIMMKRIRNNQLCNFKTGRK